jgi:hypothetical protein
MLLGETSSMQWGLAEEEDGVTFRIWGYEAGQAEHQVFTIALDADVATLTRTACLPQPACEDTAPLEVVIRRAS